MTGGVVGLVLIGLAAVSLFGTYGKLRDRDAVYRQWWLGREWIAERDSDPTGYWLSVSINVLVAALLLAVGAYLLLQGV